jgi:hypothetical protein
MDTGTTHDELLALHLSRLVGWLVGRFAVGLLLGTIVALLVGWVGWDAGHLGWVVAAPGLGLLVLGLVLLTSSAPEPWSSDN